MDAVPLREAFAQVQSKETHVPQEERDALFIQAKFLRTQSA
jgi:hypothetical protein